MDRQQGLVGHRQLRAEGLDAKGIARRVGNGELVSRTKWAATPSRSSASAIATARHGPRPRKQAGGAYSANDAPLTLDGRRWAAILAAPAGSWVGGASGCALLDLERHLGPMHVVHLGSTWVPPIGVKATRTTKVHPDDLISVRGIPTSSVARSVIDGANDAAVSDERLDGWLDRAIELRIYDELAMRRVIQEREMLRGAKRLDSAIDRLDDLSGEFRSRFEQKVTRLVQTSTVIPPPVVNVLVDGFRPDLRFIGTHAIVECDGRDYHRSMAQIVADERREEILRARGFAFLRLRWGQVQYEPERTLARIERFVLAHLGSPELVAA